MSELKQNCFPFRCDSSASCRFANMFLAVFCCFICSDCSVSSESEGEELPEDEAESISELTTDCSIKETTPVNGK